MMMFVAGYWIGAAIAILASRYIAPCPESLAWSALIVGVGFMIAIMWGMK